MIGLDDLTPEQLAIVRHRSSPLRVAAGAGTGKTTTIVLRLATAITEGLAPERAVGLTFTNKAAEELADRLREQLPELTAAGREVPVTTYHGFAYSLLLEHGTLVGVERGAVVIGAGYQRQLLDEALRTAGGRAIDLTHPPSRIAEAATLLRQLSDNLATADDLEAIAPPPDERNDVWSQRLDLVGVIRAYETAKRRLGVLDHGDLIRLAHRLITDHPQVATRIRDRYEMVLLDEYQDTDPGQRRLLQALLGPGFPVTAVGDPDQTIYEWRGASLGNFASFPEHFPTRDGTPAPTLPLTLNRRSDRAIIDIAERVKREIGSADAVPPLRPRDDAGPGTVQTGWFRTSHDEAAWIARRLVHFHELGTPWRAMAVLVRKNKTMHAIRQALEAEDIPVEVVSLGGLLDVPEVADLHAWLRILRAPEDSAALVRILFGGRYRLGFGDLAPLHGWIAAQGRSPTDVDAAPGWPLLEAIDRLDDVTGLDDDATARLRAFRDEYRDLLAAAQSLTLVELSRRVLDTMDAWKEVAAMPPGKALSTRLDLYRFLDLAESWSPLEGRPSLDGFLAYLEVLADGADAAELDTATVSNEDAVSLSTVHRAKGLEWDVVVLPSLAKDTFPSRATVYDDPYARARFVPYELRLDAEHLPDLASATGTSDRSRLLREHHLSQEWRTAYVATTRARRVLVATGAWWEPGRRRPNTPSALFDIIAGHPAAAALVETPHPGAAPDFAAVDTAIAPPDPLFAAGWRAALHDRAAGGPLPIPDEMEVAVIDEMGRQLRDAIERLPLVAPPAEERPRDVSVTGLVTLASCPRRFAWTEIDRLPRRPSPWLRRGIEFHRRVELHNLGQLPLEDLDPDAYDAVATSGQERPPTTDPYETFIRSRFAAAPPLFTEVPIDVPVGPVRLRGRIDAIYDRGDSHWEIVDYKSGRAANRPERWVQLQAYAVAVDLGAVSITRPDALTLTFAYFGGSELEEESVRLDRRLLEEAHETITSLAERAAALDHEPTPSEACETCDFLTFCEAGNRYLNEPSRPRPPGSA